MGMAGVKGRFVQPFILMEGNSVRCAGVCLLRAQSSEERLPSGGKSRVKHVIHSEARL